MKSQLNQITNIYIYNKTLNNNIFYYEQTHRPETYNKLYIANITHYYHFESELNLNSGLVLLKIKMLTDSNRYEGKVYPKIRIMQQKETRKTKFGSKCTETSAHKKIYSDEIQYGTNTRRRLHVQSQYLQSIFMSCFVLFFGMIFLYPKSSVMILFWIM